MHATPEIASAATAFGLPPPDTNPAPPLVMRLARDFGAAAVVREEADGAVVFEIPCSNGYAFRLWLFAMMDKAEVIGPPDVRELVVRWLDEVAERA